MLKLTRRIAEEDVESVNIHIRYAHNLNLRKLIISLGGNPDRLSSLHDVVSVTPLRICNPTGREEEVVLGVDAPRHIEIVRSEIDTHIRISS